MSLTLSLRRSARVHRSCPALRHGEDVLSWGALAGRVSRLATGLIEAGAKAGDRVALLGFNSPSYFEALLAVPWCGGIVVPLNTRLSQHELAEQLEDSGSTLLLYGAAQAELASALCAQAEDTTALSLESDWEKMAACPGAPDYEVEGGEAAGIFYTGGSTGKAKGVVLTHANILANVSNLLPMLRFSSDTRCLHAAPMFHIADSLGIFGVTIAGGYHAFLPRYDPGDFVSAVEREAINFTTLVPTMIRMLLDHAACDADRLYGLRDLFYGGSAMPQPLLEKFLQALPHIDLHQGYGLTETSPTATYLGPDGHRDGSSGPARPGSAGQQVMTVDVAIMDDQGKRLGDGEVGEICIKGPTVMKEYWRAPEQTAEAFNGRWLRTGDLGRLDEDGFLYVVDRAKDMIISGGENIYSAEVETVLLTHPDIQEAAVVGRPDPHWGEVVHAVVRCREGRRVTRQVLAAYCRERLAGYKIPKTFDIRFEPLPLSGAGKILKSALKTDAENHRENHA